MNKIVWNINIFIIAFCCLYPSIQYRGLAWGSLAISACVTILMYRYYQIWKKQSLLFGQHQLSEDFAAQLPLLRRGVKHQGKMRIYDIMIRFLRIVLIFLEGLFLLLNWTSFFS